MTRRAVVALSGGVDSSVAAARLVEDGFDVIGIMLKLWRGEEINHASGCCNVGAAEDARRICDLLGIPFYVLNLAGRFEESVIANFKSDYASGRTPNPCVRCNQWIKFDELLKRADALDADVLATGHYARVHRDGDSYRLLRAADAGKDQSYVLWMLSQEQLSRCRFPVGNLHKSRTRALAAELGFRTARKPDSQEICFVRGGDFNAFVDIELAAASVPGPIVDTSGRNVGRHRGIGRYTIGQRKGLGISLGVPVFVTSLEAAGNTVVVGSRAELEVDGFRADEAVFNQRMPEDGTGVLVQHRAHGDVHPATVVRAEPGRFEVAFERPVEAVAPGQSAALYSAAVPDQLIGGGVIAATVPAGARV